MIFDGKNLISTFFAPPLPQKRIRPEKASTEKASTEKRRKKCKGRGEKAQK